MNKPQTSSDSQETSRESWGAEPPRILSNRDRDIFLALLDASPDPTEAAKNAAARFNKGHWVGEAYHFQTLTHAPNAGDASDE